MRGARLGTALTSGDFAMQFILSSKLRKSYVSAATFTAYDIVELLYSLFQGKLSSRSGDNRPTQSNLELRTWKGSDHFLLTLCYLQYAMM